MTAKTKLALGAAGALLLLAVATAVVISVDSRIWRGKKQAGRLPPWRR
jgi:hypothetical protein